MVTRHSLFKPVPRRQKIYFLFYEFFGLFVFRIIEKVSSTIKMIFVSRGNRSASRVWYIYLDIHFLEGTTFVHSHSIRVDSVLLTCLYLPELSNMWVRQLYLLIRNTLPFKEAEWEFDFLLIPNIIPQLQFSLYSSGLCTIGDVHIYHRILLIRRHLEFWRHILHRTADLWLVNAAHEAEVDARKWLRGHSLGYGSRAWSMQLWFCWIRG